MTKNDLLLEAKRIGDEYLLNAQKDANGLFWKSMRNVGNRVVEWQKIEHLYAGVSGIALFLLELHVHTHEEKYLNTAIDAMKWVDKYCKKKNLSYAFYTGKAGLSYVYLRLYQITQDEKFLNKSCKIIEKCEIFLQLPAFYYDLLNGISGTVLGLIHLHSAINRDWILKIIDSYIEVLIKGVRLGPTGFYWDRIKDCVRPVTGFSHGPSGIALVFLELGNYFHNKAFYWLAEQAMAYESRYLDKEKNDWLDLRKINITQNDYDKYKEAFLKKNWNLFTKASEMNAWCYGAAGIGLTRLRAYNLLSKSIYKFELDLALNKTIKTDVKNIGNNLGSNIICHGKSGNAEIFIETYKIFKNQKYLNYATNIIQQVYDEKKLKNSYKCGINFLNPDKEEDTSLFNGNAGIGYTYLRLLDPDMTPSILYPIIKKPMSESDIPSLTPFKNIIMSKEIIKNKILHGTFGKTLSLFNRDYPNRLTLFLKKNKCKERTSLENVFKLFMRKEMKQLKGTKKQFLNELFKFELMILNTDNGIKSISLLNFKELVFKNEYEHRFKNNLFNEVQWIINPDIKIHFSKHNMINPKDKINRNQNSQNITILKPTSSGITVHQISNLSFVIMDAFKKPIWINEVIEIMKTVLNPLDDLTAEDNDKIVRVIWGQIKELISFQLLISV